MKLSIIVPVYKVEPFLRRCVDSILAQTFTDFELILVDDGSPDGCPVICDHYAQIDDRVKVVHKPNGGISSARNAGLDVAQGEYIGFVDSDDYVSKRMYEVLVRNAEQYCADISAMGYIEVTADGEICKYCSALTKDFVYHRSDFIDHFYPDIRWHIMPSVCNKISSRKLFNNYRFPVGSIYEDSFSQLPLYDMCQTIVVSKECRYYYVCSRTDSIMNTAYSVKNLDLLDLGQSQYEFFCEKSLYAQSQFALEEYTNKYIRTALAVAYLNPALKPEFRHRRRNYIRLLPRVLANPKTCRLKKLVVLLTLVDVHHALLLTKRFFPELLIRQMREEG